MAPTTRRNGLRVPSRKLENAPKTAHLPSIRRPRKPVVATGPKTAAVPVLHNLRNRSVKLKQTNLNTTLTRTSTKAKAPQELINHKLHACFVKLTKIDLDHIAQITPKSLPKTDSNAIITKPIHCNESQPSLLKTKNKSARIRDAFANTLTEAITSPTRVIDLTNTNSPLHSVAPSTFDQLGNNIISQAGKTDLQRHVPIYKLNANAVPISQKESYHHEEDSSVYDYFSNSQEMPVQDERQNREIIKKLKLQNKIQLVKKKAPAKSAPKKSKPVGRVQKKETVALKQLKENLLSVLKEKQKNTASSSHSRNDQNASSPQELMNDICETTEVQILQKPINNIGMKNQVHSIKRLDHSKLSLIGRKPLCQSSPIPNKQLPTNDLSTPLMPPFVNRLRFSKPSHQSTPIRPNNPSKTTDNAVYSPWRIADESIPKTFYYAASNDSLLPTFSSDVPQNENLQQPQNRSSTSLARIPPHPVVADKQTNNTNNPINTNLDQHQVLNSISPIKVHNARDTIIHQSDESLDLSNIENVQPKTSSIMPANSNRLATKLVLGERNTNPKRSPLKALTIRNVILSPPQSFLQASKTVSSRIVLDVSPEKLITRNELASVNSPTVISANASNIVTQPATSNDSRKTSANPAKRKSIATCFGFDSDSDDDANYIPPNAAPTNMLKQKMKELQRLLPSPSAGPSRVVPMAKAPPKLFDQTDAAKRTTSNSKTLFQQNVEQPKAAVTSTDNVQSSSLNRSDSFDCVRWGSQIEQEECPALFETLWPEKDKPTRRSYTRVPKRRRNIYSEDEDSDVDELVHAKRTKTTKRRRDKEAAAAAKELEQFAKKFEKECEMVDNFEMVVDKSA